LDLLYIQDLEDSWKLYGKTGYGNQRDDNGHELDKGQGWFVGWIEKDDRKVYFAKFIQDNVKTEPFPSLRAKDYVIRTIVGAVKQQA
jgi:beta-lactamase class D